MNEDTINPNPEGSNEVGDIDPKYKKLKGPMDLLKDAWNKYIDRMSTLISIQAIQILTVGAAAGTLYGIYKTDINVIVATSISVIIAIIAIIFITWTKIAIVEAVASENEIGVGESFGLGQHKILSFWWVQILSTFFVAGAILLFIIPGIIFGMWFAFAATVMIVEGKKGVGGLNDKQGIRTRSLAWNLRSNYSHRSNQLDNQRYYKFSFLWLF
ncbi:MAG: hypothetical protein COV70_04075 [Parcubacteria group bacterium CG11_big_fil_rev_8_21_14_0_20_39_22]|nr:MAG: hypothetical protein COV70_04075 [Parcubacteria group bacterium CG11_big_fil_rev_8_21_14_0_20_39_22]